MIRHNESTITIDKKKYSKAEFIEKLEDLMDEMEIAEVSGNVSVLMHDSRYGNECRITVDRA